MVCRSPKLDTFSGTDHNHEKPMTKSELIEALSNRRDLTARDAKTIVDTIMTEIGDTLAIGGRVELRGFGSFSVKVRPARQGRNPRTGASVSVAEKRVPFFKAGKELRQRVDGGRTVGIWFAV